jgi:predicted nucleotidyltransferase
VLGGKTLDDIVGVGRELNLQGPDRPLLPLPVEDDDAARTAQSHVAGEAVDELTAVTEGARVEDVVPVEEIEHVAKDAHVEDVRAYLDEVAARLQAVLGNDLVGVYAGGSYALGGYEAGRSDLDVAAVIRRPLAAGVADRVVEAVRHESLSTPARKLELVVYSVDESKSGAVEPGFQLNVNTGPGEPLRVDLAPRPGEGHWFAIDRAVLAEHGIALLGPSAAEVFVAPPLSELRPVLVDVLRWYLREEPDSEDGLLNAGRALRFAREGVWAPKPAMRGWAARAREAAGTRDESIRRVIADLERA